MLIRKYTKQLLALSLAGLTVLATAPVSMAEVASANIGSVSAVGSVELRGVGVSEGTLFSGDRVNVGKGAYAKVVLGTGSKLELDGSSDVTVSKDGDAINIEMKSGNIAFTGTEKPVRVRVGAYEITAAKNARGTVAYVGSTALGIRVIDGSVSVRNATTKKSFTLQKGTEQIVSLTDSTQTGSVRLASSGLPSSIPAAPSMPRQSSGGLKTALLVATVVGSAGAIAVMMSKNDDTDQQAADRLKKQQVLNNVKAIATTASEAKTTATAVATVGASALAVINSNATIGTPANAAAKATLVANANALISKANTAVNSIISIQAQINQLEAQIEASGTITQTQQNLLDSLLSQLEVQRKAVNDSINDLDTLINNANNTAGGTIINDPNLEPVDSPDTSSPSNP